MTIVVGDLHGKLEFTKEVLNKFSNDRIIFVGDYLDSFEHPTETHIELLELLLERCDGDQVQCLLGNHELSYLMPYTLSCSGYRYDMQAYFDADPSLPKEMVTKFKTYAWEQGWLITHAGVSADWLPVDPEFLPNCLDVPPCTERLYDIGYARGGRDKVGGPFWCDYYMEFKPIAGVKQIFGHTGSHPFEGRKGIVNKGDNYNIDCLDHCNQVLKLKNGEVYILEL
jgi:hypothetical protein